MRTGRGWWISDRPGRRISHRRPVRLPADCRYKLWCNGVFVSFGPAKGDGKVWYYDALDLAPWLRAGINVLAVQVLHYPADPARGNHSLFRSRRPGLYWEGPAGDWRCHTEQGKADRLDAEHGRPELSQHTQVFGILTGTLDEAQGRRDLLRSMEGPGIAQCTVAMCNYLFRSLERTGLYEYTDRCWDIWRRMLADRCTTCVEAEGYARSECHAWGALALYELPSAVLGVRPAAPGYERILVRPCPGLLTSASGTVHTPRGDVSVSWEKRDGELSLRIEAEEEVKKRIVTE